MKKWKIHFISKCDNCGNCWEVRAQRPPAGYTEADFRTTTCDDCGWLTVGLTPEESDIWWAIVDNEETEEADWQEW